MRLSRISSSQVYVPLCHISPSSEKFLGQQLPSSVSFIGRECWRLTLLPNIKVEHIVGGRWSSYKHQFPSKPHVAPWSLHPPPALTCMVLNLNYSPICFGLASPLLGFFLTVVPFSILCTSFCPLLSLWKNRLFQNTGEALTVIDNHQRAIKVVCHLKGRGLAATQPTTFNSILFSSAVKQIKLAYKVYICTLT